METVNLEHVVLAGVEAGNITAADVQFYMYLKCEESDSIVRMSLNSMIKEFRMSKTTILKTRNKLKSLGVIDWTVVDGVCEYVFLLVTGTKAQKDIAMDRLTENMDWENSTWERN